MSERTGCAHLSLSHAHAHTHAHTSRGTESGQIPPPPPIVVIAVNHHKAIHSRWPCFFGHQQIELSVFTTAASKSKQGLL